MTNISSLKNTDLSIGRFNMKSAQCNVLPNLHIAQRRNFVAACILDAKQIPSTVSPAGYCKRTATLPTIASEIRSQIRLPTEFKRVGESCYHMRGP